MQYMRRRSLEGDRPYYDSSVTSVLVIIIFVGLTGYVLRKVILTTLTYCGIMEKNNDDVGVSTVVISD